MKRRIERLGGVVVRQSASHRIYEKDGCRTMVAQHGGGREIPSGTLHQIERQMEPVFGKRWLIRR